MLRLLDISVAAVLVVLLLPSILIVQAVLAVGSASVQRRLHLGLHLAGFDTFSLLWRVLQGRLTLREWWLTSLKQHCKEVN